MNNLEATFSTPDGLFLLNKAGFNQDQHLPTLKETENMSIANLLGYHIYAENESLKLIPEVPKHGDKIGFRLGHAIHSPTYDLNDNARVFIEAVYALAKFRHHRPHGWE